MQLLAIDILSISKTMYGLFIGFTFCATGLLPVR